MSVINDWYDVHEAILKHVRQYMEGARLHSDLESYWHKSEEEVFDDFLEYWQITKEVEDE